MDTLSDGRQRIQRPGFCARSQKASECWIKQFMWFQRSTPFFSREEAPQFEALFTMNYNKMELQPGFDLRTNGWR